MENKSARQEALRQEILFNEADILKALTAPEQRDAHTETIEVKFGSARFRFRIRALSEREYDQCRERNTRYQKNRRLGGMRLPESTDTVGYHSSLIYQATVEEDRARLWDNKAFWQAVNSDPTRKGKQQVVTGTDMVDLLIPYAGTKQAIIDRIEKLSGYDGEEDADGANSFGDTVKN